MEKYGVISHALHCIEDEHDVSKLWVEIWSFSRQRGGGGLVSKGCVEYSPVSAVLIIDFLFIQ